MVKVVTKSAYNHHHNYHLNFKSHVPNAIVVGFLAALRGNQGHPGALYHHLSTYNQMVGGWSMVDG